MPFRHKMQASRFEFKFVIDESCAQGMRDFMSGYLEPDEHASKSPDHSYPVNSLYIDSPSLMLYRQTDGGLKNRFKLRVRFYDGEPDSPAFLEIKRRITGVICKERAVISRAGVECLLDGGLPDVSYLIGDNGNSKAVSALQNFCSLYESIDALPQIYVCYSREAYVSPDSDQLRITFDRNLPSTVFDRMTCLIPPGDGARPETGNENKVILELKFTDTFPSWMQEMVQAFNLQRCSVPKYNMCIESLNMRPKI